MHFLHLQEFHFFTPVFPFFLFPLSFCVCLPHFQCHSRFQSMLVSLTHVHACVSMSVHAYISMLMLVRTSLPTTERNVHPPAFALAPPPSESMPMNTTPTQAFTPPPRQCVSGGRACWRDTALGLLVSLEDRDIFPSQRSAYLPSILDSVSRPYYHGVLPRAYTQPVSWGVFCPRDSYVGIFLFFIFFLMRRFPARPLLMESRGVELSREYA